MFLGTVWKPFTDKWYLGKFGNRGMRNVIWESWNHGLTNGLRDSKKTIDWLLLLRTVWENHGLTNVFGGKFGNRGMTNVIWSLETMNWQMLLGEEWKPWTDKCYLGSLETMNWQLLFGEEWKPWTDKFYLGKLRNRWMSQNDKCYLGSLETMNRQLSCY